MPDFLATFVARALSLRGEGSGGSRHAAAEPPEADPGLLSRALGWTGEDMFGHLPDRSYIAPSFVDLDGDGDSDLVLGTYYGTVDAFRNGTDGTSGAFVEWDGLDRFQDVDAGYMATPAFADIDGDGDPDMVLGSREEGLSVWRNGSATGAGRFTDASDHFRFRFATDPGVAIDPAFTDIDGDGDQDMVMGDGHGNLVTWRNGTTGDRGAYTLWGDGDPLAAAWVDGGSTPAFIDLDADGDPDLVSGTRDGQFVSFRNGTDGTSGDFHPWDGTDPFAGVDIGVRADPAFADLDGDGDLDFVTGSYDFILYAYENVALPGRAPRFDFDQASQAGDFSTLSADGILLI